MDGHAYIRRNPRRGAHFQLVEDYFEVLERSWDERYAGRYGHWRGHIQKVIFEYLDCGDLRSGFARIRCTDCGHEYLLPLSCKRRHFCPSCHERRVLEFGEFCASEVLCDVPHRQWVFSLPKMLRPWFMHDRRLLGELAHIVWGVLSKFIKASGAGCLPSDAKAACVLSIQTFGEQVNFNPHIHVIAADGCFLGDGSFAQSWAYDTTALKKAFESAVFKLLAARGLSEVRIDTILSWHHSGFQVYRGPQIAAGDKAGLERLAQYIVRCPFAVSRMTYLRDSAQVLYHGKTSGATMLYPALDFLALLIVQIPAPRDQMVRYLGYYSNKSRGLRKKVADDRGETLQNVPPKRLSSRSWARLIAKVYLDDPLTCPKCQGSMKVVAFIEQETVITKILKHLGLWELICARPPPASVPEEYPEGFIQPDEYYAEEYPQPVLLEYEYEAC